MSRKRSKKTNPESSDEKDDEVLSEPAEDETTGDAELQPVQEEDDDFDEFSLDQLSQAYAEVLKGRPGAGSDSEPDEVEDPPELETSNEKIPVVDDNAGCQISPESIIESILFVGAPKGVTLNSRKIAAVLRDVSPKEVTKTVRELNAKYEKENSAYRIESDGGVFRMILDPNLVDFQQDFFGRNREVRLTQSAIDVMAIVAYNQPVTRDQVDKIRARPSGSVLAQLVRRELLFIEPGETDPKVRYYATTDRFLDLFQLEEIADLPQSHDVSDIEELAD